MQNSACSPDRRTFLAASAAALGAAALASPATAADTATQTVVTPPAGKRILLSCKLGMIAREVAGKKLSLAERLSLAAEAGLDGVDLDQAAEYTPEQARDAVQQSRVFVHNAINHAHWQKRLTSANEADRAQARANIEHCIRVSHAAGGSGVLIVVGQGSDGPEEEINERARQEIKKLLPMCAAMGQRILVENVWNKMHYDHESPPEQSADRFVKFLDSFNSPWIGMYYDIGNHWKYGQPREWIHAFGPRCVKLDIKGFSRAQDNWTEITAGDLPWDQVRKGLDEIGFTGWATAEIKGGGLERLTVIRKQMQEALGA